MSNVTKTLSMDEVNLIAWFNGQINVVEHATGEKVEKMYLAIDRAVSNDISVTLVTVPHAPATPQE